MALGSAGCAHAPRSVSRDDSAVAARYGQWRGKALVADPRDGKQKELNLDVIAQAPDRLRVDLTSSLGAYVGTFAARDRRFEFLSALERRFVTGPADSAGARDLLRLSVEPAEAVELLLGGPMPASWKCETDASKRRTCANGKSGASVTVEFDGDARRFAFRAGARASPALVRLEPSRLDAPPEARQFQIERPRGFQEQDVGRGTVPKRD